MRRRYAHSAPDFGPDSDFCRDPNAYGPPACGQPAYGHEPELGRPPGAGSAPDFKRGPDFSGAPDFSGPADFGTRGRAAEEDEVSLSDVLNEMRTLRQQMEALTRLVEAQGPPLSELKRTEANPEYLDIEEVAAIVRLSETWIETRYKAGAFPPPSLRLGGRGKRFWLRENVIAWLRRQVGRDPEKQKGKGSGKSKSPGGRNPSAGRQAKQQTSRA